MQKQHYFVRNFGRNYSFCESLPDLAFVSRLVRCVMQDGGRELIYLYGSHTSYWSNKCWYWDCYSIFVLPCPKRWRRWLQLWGVLEPEGLEWNKFQLIFCIYNLNIFPSMTGEWQPRPFPFSICYDVIVMCIRDVMPSLLALNFSFNGLTLDFCSTYIINSVLLDNYITNFVRNSLVSADTAVFRPKFLHFGRNKNISAEYSVLAEFRFFRMACFGFRCFGKKSVSVGH